MPNNVEWVDCETEVPDAPLVVRILDGGSIRFTRYFGNVRSEVLMDFPYGALDQTHYEETLLQCRKLVDPQEKIYVERPEWKFYLDHLSDFPAEDREILIEIYDLEDFVK